MPRTSLEQLVKSGHSFTVAGDGDVYQAGEPARQAYVLLGGILKRHVTLPSKKTKVVELIQTPQIISLGELFRGSEYTASCTALAPSLIFAIDAEKLFQAIRRYPHLSWRLIQELAAKHCATEFDITGFHHGLTGTQRVLDYFLKEAGGSVGLAGETTVNLEVGKRVIAARLGMSSESFSRNLRQLSDLGVLVVEGRRIHIQNAALVDIESGKLAKRIAFTRGLKLEGLGRTKGLSPGALVNMCGRLRLISQRMAIAWALSASSTSAKKAQIKLQKLQLEFERCLLRVSQSNLNSDFEAYLQSVSDIWTEYKHLLVANEATANNAIRVFSASERTLQITDRLTKHAEDAACLPEARNINVAGRNRMLSQRLVKLYLFWEWETDHQQLMQCIDQSCQEFERNLKELGKNAAGHPEVGAQLDMVAVQWQKLIRALVPDLPGAEKPDATRHFLEEGERLLRAINTLVKLYERITTLSAASGPAT